MVPIGFTNDQKTMSGGIWGYICTLNIKIHIKNNTWDVIIFTIMEDTFAKRMYSLANDENY